MRHFFLLPGTMRSVSIEPDEELAKSPEITEPLYPYEHDINTSDGREFIDDGQRINEQPLQVQTDVQSEK